MIENTILVSLLFLSLGALFAGIVALVKFRIKNKELNKAIDDYGKLLSQKKSSEVRLGQIAEHLAPFVEEFKYDPKKARFIGNPIDYIVFDDEKIVFLEVKSGESKLSLGQKKIRDLILNGKVEFETMTIK